MASVLIAEDDRSLARILQINLEFEGLDVLIAYDGEETLKIVKEQVPDLILLDIMLPKIDGFEVAKILRKDPRTSSVPIIILTAKGSDEDLLTGWEVGAFDYFVKPFNLTRLIDTVFKSLSMEKPKQEVKVVPPEEKKKIGVAIVGADEEGIELLKFLIGNHEVSILAIADRDENAKGLKLAKKMGIYATSNLADIFTIPGLRIIVATKHRSILNLLHRGDSVEIIGDQGIKFLLTLINVAEEREARERMLNQKLSNKVQELTRLLSEKS